MRTSCKKCLCQNLLNRITCARSLYVDPLCISLCQDLCIRILYDDLCKISVCGFLLQDLSVWMSASGSCRPFCARSLYEDRLRMISLSGYMQQDLVGPLVPDVSGSLLQDLFVRMSASGSSKGSLVQDLCTRISCARFLCQGLLSKTICARSLYEDILSKIFLL